MPSGRLPERSRRVPPAFFSSIMFVTMSLLCTSSVIKVTKTLRSSLVRSVLTSSESIVRFLMFLSRKVSRSAAGSDELGPKHASISALQ